MGISRKHLSNITNGNAAITADVALRIQALTGSKADVWLNMQTAYDLSLLRDDKKYDSIECVA
jgi:addiction module HigA family antidote